MPQKLLLSSSYFDTYKRGLWWRKYGETHSKLWLKATRRGPKVSRGRLKAYRGGPKATRGLSASRGEPKATRGTRGGLKAARGEPKATRGGPNG